MVRRPALRRGHGSSYFAGDREIAHFHGDARVDVRLTSAVIGARWSSGGFERNVHARSPTANWVAVQLTGLEDVDVAIRLLREAVAANR
ncbi:MAG TPA: luciferase family protein [Thermoplasmata archaeon]|nr:luciferase family protein [Thermoplasmata archaeon]